jgi:hypothetical protein
LFSTRQAVLNAVFMKKLWVLALLPVLASCDVYLIEPVFDARDRVVGHYHVNEYSETYNDSFSYSMDITKSGARDLYLNNFYGLGLRVRAYMQGDKIIIPLQVRDGYEIEGIGTDYGSTVEFNYRVKDLYTCACTDFLESTAWRE